MHGLNLNQNLELNLGLTLNQQLMLSMLAMDLTQLQDFLNNEFSKNPALEGELPSLITMPEIPYRRDFQSDTFKDELLFQVRTEVQKTYHKTCNYLIESMDGRGYITESTGDLSNRLGLRQEQIEECIGIIQTLEPLGVGARDLRECLLIQLRNLYPSDLVAIRLVGQYLDLLLNRDFKSIIKETLLSKKEVENVYSLIKTLNPIPSNGWNDGYQSLYITPEILLYDQGDELVIEIPSQGIDKLKLNPIYTDPENLAKYKKIFKDDLNRANTILKGLENRRSTLYNISNIMIMTQYEYIKYGKPLKKLGLKDIANRLGLHESTISRGIDGKYILYNEGIISLRSLLSRGGSDGSSADQIKQRLGLIIKGEDKKRPFSDPQLVEELESYGLKISRRTVTKYRNELKIDSASNRKKYSLEMDKC